MSGHKSDGSPLFELEEDVTRREAAIKSVSDHARASLDALPDVASASAGNSVSGEIATQPRERTWAKSKQLASRLRL